ncbi:MAG: protoporphyrinogen/coproporphyrinogen oxidase [Panacagrimonas sp.]
MSDHHVIVVGAGPSGLAAAFRLQQAGVKVRILEAADKVGGRMQTDERNGYIVDRAATIFPSAYDTLLGLVADAGLGGEMIRGGSTVGFARGDRIHYLDSSRLFLDSARTSLLSWRSKLAMAKLFIDNYRIGKYLSYEDLSIAARYDTESAVAYARRRTTEEVSEFIIDATIRGVLGTRGDEVSVLEFFFSFNKVIGGHFLALRSGMGSYPKLMARHFKDLVLGARVTQITERAQGVEVSWQGRDGQQHVEQASGCVVAVPAHHAAALVPGLDAWRRTFLEQVNYSTCVTLNIGLERPPANNPAFFVQIPSSVEDSLLGIVLDHNKAPGRVPAGKGGLTIYAMSDVSERLMQEPDEVVIDRLMRAGERVLGKIPAVEWIDVNRWHPVIVRSRPGYYVDLARFHNIRRASDRRVQLAGDYFSSSNCNTASAAGERAARDLVALLKTGAPHSVRH